MRIDAIAAKLGLQEMYAANPAAEITGGYTSDMLSDVMAGAEEGSVLITIQAHKNTIAVASLTGIRAVIICQNRPVAEDMITAAEAEGINLYVTGKNQFQMSCTIGRLLDIFSCAEK